MSRRKILAGLATVAAAGIGGTGAQALALPQADARLLEMHAAERRANAAHNAACSVEDEAPDDQREAAEAALRAAERAWEGVLHAMADLPAAGLVGLAVKAAQVCRALDEGRSQADAALATSLRADLARLVPRVAA